MNNSPNPATQYRHKQTGAQVSIIDTVYNAKTFPAFVKVVLSDGQTLAADTLRTEYKEIVGKHDSA